MDEKDIVIEFIHEINRILGENQKKRKKLLEQLLFVETFG